MAPGLLITQGVKPYTQPRLSEVVRRVVHGTEAAVTAMLARPQTGQLIPTAYIERLNAPFRSALAPWVRRGRARAHHPSTLTAGMYRVGCAYNFCWTHDSLRPPAPANAARRWQDRTPAMAAGLTGHPWTMSQLLPFQVPRPPWVPVPPRRCRPRQAPSPVQAQFA